MRYENVQEPRFSADHRPLAPGWSRLFKTDLVGRTALIRNIANSTREMLYGLALSGFRRGGTQRRAYCHVFWPDVSRSTLDALCNSLVISRYVHEMVLNSLRIA